MILARNISFTINAGAYAVFWEAKVMGMMDFLLLFSFRSIYTYENPDTNENIRQAKFMGTGIITYPTDGCYFIFFIPHTTHEEIACTIAYEIARVIDSFFQESLNLVNIWNCLRHGKARHSKESGESQVCNSQTHELGHTNNAGYPDIRAFQLLLNCINLMELVHQQLGQHTQVS